MLDGDTDNMNVFPYTEIPVRFPGTGDIFSAVLIGKYRVGNSIEDSVQSAMKVVEKLIDLNKDNVDKYKGIPLEQYIEVITK